jgi:flagellar hook protein FlgE
MSLYGALFSGVSGLQAESAAMGAISDNITNVNTVGYKQTDVNFQTLVTHQVSQSSYSPGGVQSKPRMQVDTQGLLQSTGSSTDVAISGQGFFIVDSVAKPGETGGGTFAYTRAGSFKVDKQGYLQNVSGWYLQGWPLTNWDSVGPMHQVVDGFDLMKAYKDTTGNYVYINDSAQPNARDLQPLNLNQIAGTAASTTNIRMGANLPSGDSVGDVHMSNAQVYDSLGNASNVQMTWTKTGENQWSVEATPPLGSTEVQLLDSSGKTYSDMGRLDLNAMPASGSFFTMLIKGQTWSFNASASPAIGAITAASDGTVYVNPTGLATSAYTGNLALAVQGAFAASYLGTTVADNTATYPLGTTVGDDFICINGTNVNLNGAVSASDAAAIINSAAPVGASAMADPTGNLIIYPTVKGTVQLAGSGQFSALSTTSVSVLLAANLANGGELTIGSTTISANAGDALTSLQTAINAKGSTTGVFAAIDAAGTTLTLYSSSATAVGFGGADDLASFSNTNQTIAAGSFPVAAADTLVIGSTTVLGPATVPNNNTGVLTAQELADNINNYASSTGVYAMVNSAAGVTIYTSSTSNIALTGTGGLAATPPTGNVKGLSADGTSNANAAGGLSDYAEVVPGTQSLQFRQLGTTTIDDITVTGIGPTGTWVDVGGAPVFQQGLATAQEQPDANTFTIGHLTTTTPYPGTMLTFNGNGTPSSITVSMMKLSWATGAQNQTSGNQAAGTSAPINLFFGDTNQSNGMTQLAGTFQLSYMTQDGAKFGNFSGVSIGTSGIVTALFDNGVTRPVFQIPIATFTNPNGMTSLTGNVFISTDFSGDPTLRTAGDAGAGSTNSSSLEASTVDIGTQFTTMIVTQRAYSAAAKVITTADSMLNDLVQIIR